MSHVLRLARELTSVQLGEANGAETVNISHSL